MGDKSLIGKAADWISHALDPRNQPADVKGMVRWVMAPGSGVAVVQTKWTC